MQGTLGWAGIAHPNPSGVCVGATGGVCDVCEGRGGSCCSTDPSPSPAQGMAWCLHFQSSPQTLLCHSKWKWLPLFPPDAPLALRQKCCLQRDHGQGSLEHLDEAIWIRKSIVLPFTSLLKSFPAVTLCSISSSTQLSPKELLPASSSMQDGVTESKLHFILTALAHFRDALAGLLLLMCFTSFCHSCFVPSK